MRVNNIAINNKQTYKLISLKEIGMKINQYQENGFILITLFIKANSNLINQMVKVIYLAIC